MSYQVNHSGVKWQGEFPVTSCQLSEKVKSKTGKWDLLTGNRELYWKKEVTTIITVKTIIIATVTQEMILKVQLLT